MQEAERMISDADFEQLLAGPPPAPFEVKGQHASNGTVHASVEDGGRLFKRNAIKFPLGGDPAATQRQVQWLVGELLGVRCYVQQGPDGVHVVMTTADLYP